MKDLRLPTGLLFAVLGIVLLGYSAVHPEVRAPMTEVNINLWSGLSLVCFGGVLLWLARRAS
jgi:hypothetical protein